MPFCISDDFFLSKNATFITVPSKHTMNEILHFFPDFNKKIYVINNITDPIFNKLQITLDKKKKQFLHVSKWEPRKNILTL